MASKIGNSILAKIASASGPVAPASTPASASAPISGADSKKKKQNKKNRKDEKDDSIPSQPLKEPTSKPTTSLNEKGRGKGKGKGKANGEPEGNGVDGPRWSEREVLLKEILVLGGTEDDLELIGGSGSEDEIEGNAVTVDPKLKNDLRAFMKGLEFASAVPDVPESDSNSELDPKEQKSRDAGLPTPKAPLTPGPSKDDQRAAATAALATIADTLETPQEQAKRAKKEARAEQRKRETEKRTEQQRLKFEADAATADEVAAKERAEARKKTREQVEDVKGRFAVAAPKKSSDWIIQPRPLWYDTEGFTALPPTATSQPLSDEIISSLSQRGEATLKSLNDLFAESLQPSGRKGHRAGSSTASGLSESDKAFVVKILTSGTSSDRLSALTLLISSAPLHSMTHLTALLTLCKKKSRDEAVRTMRSVVDWLRGGSGDDRGGGGGLPARKLRFFRDQPGLAAIAAIQKGKGKGGGGNDELPCDDWLALWTFEEWIKRWYLDLLRVIENFSVDPLPFVRTQSVAHAYFLLRDKPEQEQNLLRLLVNKLGDTDKSVASRASHHVLQVLQEHPLMKAIVVREISSLILKPVAPSTKPGTINSARHHDHARYYGSITLNQITLIKADAEVANKLVEVYFELFGDILGRATAEEERGPVEVEEEEPQGKRKRGGGNNAGDKGKTKAVLDAEEAAEKQSKLTAAILTGLNRAFPYASLDDNIFQAHMDTLFRIVHTGVFNVSVQALVLIQHITTSRPTILDRYLRVLYDTLFDTRLLTSSKQAMFLNLLFKSIKSDAKPQRTAAFVKRIVQMLPLHQPPFICGALFLLGELFDTVPGLRAMNSSSEFPPTEGEGYDGRKRDPTFANAELVPLWELTPLLNHYHPAVALNAQQLQSGRPITSSGDLEQHTLSHFLDRFVYRNPKKRLATKGASMMQPAAKGSDRSGLVLLRKGAGDSIQLNTEEFANTAESQVPVDQLFFHKYFNNKADIETAKSGRKTKRRASDADALGHDSDASESEDDEEDSEGSIAGLKELMDKDSDLDEDEVWKAMQKSMPRAVGDPGMEDVDDSEQEFDAADFDDSLGEESEVGDEQVDEADTSDDGDANVFSEGSDLLSDEDITMLEGAADDDGDTSEGGAPQLKGKKRRKTQHLPTFASAEDYAAMLDADTSEE